MGGGTLGAISSFLGESESATKSGLGAALPAILGSVINKGSTTEGASSLLNMIKNDNHDGGILDNLSGLLGGGGSAVTSLLGGGSNLLTTLLGDKIGGIANLIGSLSGLKSGSVSSLLSMAAPLVMGAIGKQATSQGLNASGLMSMLGGQSDFVKAALPTGMGSLLGFANMGDTARQTYTQAAKTVENVEQKSGSMLPWLLGGAVLLGSFLAWRSCQKPVAEAVATTATQATEVVTAKVDSAVTAVANVFKAALPGGVNLDVPKGSLEEKMVTFIQSTDTVSKNLWFDFDRLLFETGKATLKPESMEQLKNAAAIMKAFPNVKIKIGGYTDNTGKAEANMKLSGDRAKNVMAELVKLGTEAKRMEAEGYGDKHPIAPNDTEEGRAKNRRISMSVKAK